MAKRKKEGALVVLAYVHGWRQSNDGRWFKPGIAGTFNSASDAFKAQDENEKRKQRKAVA